MRQSFSLVARCFVLLLLFLGHSALLLGQGLPEMPCRPWRDSSTGRLYWNRHQPVFLMLSPTPSVDGGELLTSETMPQWASPFYFDTEGVNYLRTRSAVDTVTKKVVTPLREILWEVYADGLPPISHLAFEEGGLRSGGEMLLGEGTRLVLAAEDQTSGVHSIYYSTDSVNFTQYTGPFAPPSEGVCEFYFLAFDNVGNREQVRRQRLMVDRTPPESRCVVTGVHLDRENTVASTSTMYIEASDALSGVAKIFYRIDSAQWREYSPRSAISLSKVEDGRHKLQFYSVDVVGNREPVQEFPFFLDATAPITISDILGDRFIVGDKTYFSGRTKLKITALDNHAGVKEVLYSINGSEFKPYTDPFYMPNSQGWHSVRYFSIDSTENRTSGQHDDEFFEYRMKVDKIYVDLTGPAISHFLQGPSFMRNDTVFVSPSTLVTLRGDDPESGLKRLAYSIDDDAWEKLYEGPFDLQGLSSGEHKIEYFGYDKVENRNVAVFTFILDSDPPEVSYQLSVAPYEESGEGSGQLIFPRDAQVFLVAQDNMTGIARLQYSLNGRPRVEYTKPFGDLERGRNRLIIYAEDLVGNQSETLITFEVR